MSDKFKNKYRIPTNRLPGFDYGSQGYYFVTICTKDRLHYFGEIINVVEPHHCAALPQNQMILSDIGNIAKQFMIDIPKHYPFVTDDEFVIMPDHVHCLLFLNPENKIDWTPNQFGPQSKNLGAIIRGYKSSVKRYANQNLIDFEWQARYHDRIVRYEREYYPVKNYILNNVENLTKNELS